MHEKKQKFLLLGVDGMDPKLTRKYVDLGLMPNVKKYIEKGACRHDLVMLGGHPTVTPPMWTTLATGCYPVVHGITGFNRKGDNISEIDYALDSRLCEAEPLWNVFAEAGKKTLVWHWPGSSWPPTSESENLFVVDGTSPGSVNMSVAQVDNEFILGASMEFNNVQYITGATIEAQAACVITDLPEQVIDESISTDTDINAGSREVIIWKKTQQTSAFSENSVDLVQSEIRDAQGWDKATEGAKEFILLLSKGFIRRPCLIVKNNEGIYDTVEIYKNKKSLEPIAICPVGKMVVDVIDEAIKNDTKYVVNRNFKVLNMDPNGRTLSMYISAAMDITNDSLWHPKRIYKNVCDNVGHPAPTSMLGRQDTGLINCMLDNWYATADWQANAIQYLIQSENLDVVFSHYHAVDLEGHMFVKHMANLKENKNPVSVAEQWMKNLYVQTDYYLGKFLSYLDDGWTIMIFSDHGLVASKYGVPLLMDLNGACTPIMEEIGFTKTFLDENGRRKIKWDETRAVCQREGHIYINVKGRDKYGIVAPENKYEVEEELITALYGYRDKQTGKRIVSLALRNKDAVLLGMGGPNTGDIYVCMAEGYNFDHSDCLSTTCGEAGTSVSPIFIAAGPGLKTGYETERIIREVDFAPTVAVLAGLRMPAQCEGAPAYQIFEKDFYSYYCYQE